MVASIVVPLALQLWDRRRLSPEQRARCWNVATWGSALYAFGPLSMLGWCWVTRRPWWRILVGPLWSGACLFIVTLVDALMELGQRGELEDGLWDRLLGALLVAAAGVVLLTVMEGMSQAWRQRRRLGIAGPCPPSPPPPSALH